MTPRPLPDAGLAELLAKATTHPDLATREVALFDLEQHALTLASEVLRLRAALDTVQKLGIRALVAGWNGEGRDEPYARHPPRLGVTLKTNAGTVYAIDDAMQAARVQP